ncbi:MAG: hypothetical protein O7G87_02595 [bacterium]|nr:hypothetical protein [bacterium]
MNAPNNIHHQLLLYLDDLLAEPEKHQVEAQLAEDAALRQELAYLQHIQTAIQNRPAEPTPGLWSDIEAQIQEESQNLWTSLEWAGKRLVPLFAAAAVIMLATLGNFNGEETEVTLDDYFQNQEGLILSELDTFDNTLGIESPEAQ